MKTILKVMTSLGLLCMIPGLVPAQQNKVISKYEKQKEITANTSITLSEGFEVKAGAEFRAYISSNPGGELNYALNPSMNTIVSYTTRVPGIIEPSDPKNGINQVIVDVQTLNHYGQLVETQNVKSTPDFKDVITITEYDDADRQANKYLSFAYTSGKKNFFTKGFSFNVESYYSSANIPLSMEANAEPVHRTVFDGSRLNRIREQSYGAGYEIGSDKTTKYATLMGTNDVARYDVLVNSSTGARKLTRTGNAKYSGSEILINSFKNENVALAYLAGTVHEYKDKDDRVILRRHFNIVGSIQETLSTYYVYDDLGNLSFVLPPKVEADADGIPSQSTLDNLCYQYRYDDQNRMIAKKVPGKGWEFMVYNKLNQVIMTQDSVQRMKAPQEWSISKYDGQGRSVVTGIYTHTGSTAGTSYLGAIQSSADAVASQYETRTATGTGYTSVTYPTTLAVTLSINYYDDYNFPGGNPYPYSGSDASAMTRGLLTGSKVNVLGTTNMLWTVNYYDRDGKVSHAFKQHYKGSTVVAGNYDEISTTYDFTGAVLSATRSHKVAGTEQLKTLDEYTYDHRGRKVDSWQTIGSGTRTLLSRLEYDDLGHVYKKNLHSSNSGSSFLQTITYAYNTRDWAKSMTAPLLAINTTFQPNGNISTFSYTGQYGGSRSFTYGYDKLDRLISSTYATSGSGGTVTANKLNEEISYDKMGNILSLKRGLSTNTPISYTYANGGMSNLLSSTSGAVAGSYTYDGNGNALTDGKRGVTSISYNRLNLPQSVTRSSGGNAAYTYDATGTKLKSVQGTVTREYIDGIQYTGGNLEFFATEEGRALKNGSTYSYEYNLTDHLGNVRVSFDKHPTTGAARVIQENEYYAFGLDTINYISGTKNNYLYNGKEEQDVLSNMYDYGARFYDPVIGRWQSVDPLAEQGRRWSPYAYAFDNPIYFIDPDGMWPGPNFLSDTWASAKNSFKGYFKSIAHAVQNPGATARAVVNNVKSMSVGELLVSPVTKSPGAHVLKTEFAAAKAIIQGDGKAFGNIIGRETANTATVLATAAAGEAIGGTKALIPKANNPVPNELARVVPTADGITTLGKPGTPDVFVTAASDIKGLNSSQIATKLAIPESQTGFTIFTFPTPTGGIATPIYRSDPGFVGFGRTMGGAREFTIPNQPIPANATKNVIP
ncbi:polymorphic toxin type 10 domain-containing protein [Pedobacter sp. JY14-1]|uniref:polymorphic toxin type 10 domain-containing protein n=1 Tax=Pedobacter sp. JY14-1 TaxID=3034151 RepID=UPI0023E10B06|nr:polymorphic toxin type 10 domain-containing protein [Pedobacter sp. JY14-1]